MQVVPLLPLQVVLFPQTRLPLHIFEPRYQTLVRDCLAASSPFGVVAIRQGAETDADPTWHSVGTLAAIERVVRLPRGRLNLVVVGGERFRMRRLVAGRPYLQAEVEGWADLDSPTTPLFTAARLRAAYDRYRASLLRMGVRIPEFGELPRDPTALAWAVGGHLVVELQSKQRLLEERSQVTRIKTELALLRREATLVDLQLANRLVRAPTYSLN
ncbi:MAG TPA: LON peptidase substrate-binding domain-containing protein [Candidatus Nanopelagicaceae bacterium]|nr:LON peptidase substrate-binding domain-containing protein [Candidatus Nanopelagicaceae bacterium]